MPRTRLMPVPATPPRPAPVSSVKPHPLAWQTALKLAGGDRSRIEVLSPTELVVR